MKPYCYLLSLLVAFVMLASLSSLARLWRYVGKLSDAQKSMLDDRFKWKTRDMEKRKEGKPGQASAALRRRSVRYNGLDVAEQSGEVLSRSVTAPVMPRDNFSYADSHVERHMLPRQLATVNGPTDCHEALDIIALGSPEQANLKKLGESMITIYLISKEQEDWIMSPPEVEFVEWMVGIRRKIHENPELGTKNSRLASSSGTNWIR